MEIRPASVADLDRCVEILYAEPSDEMVALLPSIDGARRMTRSAWTSPEGFLVAMDGDAVVGFAQTRVGARSLLDEVGPALTGFGLLGAVRLVIRGWPRSRVDFVMPPDSCKLIELHVDPTRRGQGMGGLLVDAVIDLAGTRAVSLTTRIDNPARHLYERKGFAVVEEKRHAAYEARTGSPGRVLMVRPVPFSPHA